MNVLIQDQRAQGSDFHDSGADVLGTWPRDFIQKLTAWVQEPSISDDKGEFVSRGLMDSEGRLTELGRTVRYHLEEYRLQSEKKQFLSDEFLDRLDSRSKILDIGCGAGQTLRRLDRFSPAERVGLDSDPIALALGCRLAEYDHQDMDFVLGSGHAMPFQDGYFSHAICRVALNYMHQGQALAEITRVLKPGGILYLHIEGPGFDLHHLLKSPGLRAVLGRFRNLFAGLLLFATGYQAAPGSFLGGGRTFGTVLRISRFLKKGSCEVLNTRKTRRFAGFPFGFQILARKSG